MTEAINTEIPPSGDGCVGCLAADGWWVHLRRCAQCGHIGCCDSSPGQHATHHFQDTGHRMMTSFEPGENWFWDYVEEVGLEGPELAPPTSHPVGQPAPGPAGKVPDNWQELIHR